MNARKLFTLMTVASLLGAGGCGLELKPESDDSVDKTRTSEAFGSYAGHYVGRASALSQGLGTQCALDVRISQDEKTLRFESLAYDCADGTEWGFDQPMAFELRRPTNPLQLAYDLYYPNTYVGFLNDSNSALYVGLSQRGSSITLALSQDKDGKTLEAFRLVNNEWVLFDAKSARLEAR